MCHRLASLKTHDFKLDVGLVNGTRAPKDSRQLILEALGLEDDGRAILTANDARFSPLATCRRHDVVLVRDGSGRRAARIQLHFAVDDKCVSLVQPFTLHRRRPDTALAVWQVSDGPHECWETQAIVALVEFCEYPDGKVGTILTLEYA